MLRRWPSGGWIAVGVLIIAGLSYGLFHESQANPLMSAWLTSQLGPAFSRFDFWTIVLVTGAVTVIGGQLLTRFNLKGKRVKAEIRISRQEGTTQPRKFAPPVLTHAPIDQRMRTGPEFEESRRSFRVLSPADPYGVFGIALIIIGVLTLAASLFAKSVVMEALGLSCIILGFTALSLPRELTGSKSMGTLLQGAILDIENLLEPYPAGRATYLPPKTGGPVRAYVPLTMERNPVSEEEMNQAPMRIIANDQKSILIYPVGAELATLPELQDDLSLEAALNLVLVESAEICSRVSVEEGQNMIVVSMENVKVDTQSRKYLSSLGSIPSSLAASVIALSYKTPVSLLDEKGVGRENIARFHTGN